MADVQEKKELTSSRIFLFGVIVKNPILVQVIGLCPAVASSSTFTVAALLSAAIIIDLLVCEIIASALLKSTPSWLRVAVYMTIGLCLIFPLMSVLDTAGIKVVSDAGIYLPLIAANAAVALRCEKFAVRRSVSLSVCDALATGIGTAMVLLISGLVRELLGAGEIAGVQFLEEPLVPALQMPLGGFVVLGFLAAFLKWFISKFLSEYAHDMSFKIKKTSKRSPSPQSVAANGAHTPREVFKPREVAHPSVNAQYEITVENEVEKPAITSQEPQSESFVEVFYESMSDDVFTQDFFGLDDDVTTQDTQTLQLTGNDADISQIVPDYVDDKSAEPSDESDTPPKYFEEAEKVIIPRDLDAEEANGE